MDAIEEAKAGLTAQIRELVTTNEEQYLTEGISLICAFRDAGGTQRAAYDAVHVLHIEYAESDEGRMNLVDDLLDYIVGF